MELKYKLTINDYVDFNINLMETTPKYKRSRIINRCMGFIFFIPVGLYFAIKAPVNKIVTFFLYFVIGALWFIIYKRFERWNIRKNFVRFTNKGQNYVILGTKHFTLTDQDITLRTGQFEEVNKLSDIARVTSDANHYFIHIGEAKGMPIPFTAFKSINERQMFYDTLCEKTQKAGGKVWFYNFLTVDKRVFGV